MTLEEIEHIEKTIGMWVNGGTSLNPQSVPWNHELQGLDEKEAQLRLLTLCGQALRVGAIPKQSSHLEIRSELPKLSLNSLAGKQRSIFRKLFWEIKDREKRSGILFLMQNRGWVSHPLDWLLEGQVGELPEEYQPWVDWEAGNINVNNSSSQSIEENNWEEFYPSEKLRLLTIQRATDPDIFLNLLTKKIGDESAEMRLKLLQLFDKNLNEKDVPFLESLQSDRSGKVKKVVEEMLARLGKKSLTTEDTDELISFFEKKKALISKKTSLKCKSLKNMAQKKRRKELLSKADISTLSYALELEPEAFISSWEFGEKDEIDLEISDLINRTAPEIILNKWVEHVMRLGNEFYNILTIVAPRLNQNQLYKAGEKALKLDFSFFETYFWFKKNLGTVSYKSISSSKLYKRLLKEISSDSEKHIDSEEIFYLAMIAEKNAVTKILEDLTKHEISKFDIRLHPLEFNSELTTQQH